MRRSIPNSDPVIQQEYFLRSPHPTTPQPQATLTAPQCSPINPKAKNNLLSEVFLPNFLSV